MAQEHAKAMGFLWLKMAQIFGHAWKSFGDVPSSTWVEALAQFEPEIIVLAVKLTLEKPRKWPPNLTEFIELCRYAISEISRRKEWEDALNRPKIEDYSDSTEAHERFLDAAKAFSPIMRKAMELDEPIPDFTEFREKFESGSILTHPVKPMQRDPLCPSLITTST